MNAPAAIIPNRPEKLRLRVEDFELLYDSGALADRGKTELIDGEIWIMSPQLARHARIKTDLAFELMRCLEAIRSDFKVVIEVSVRVANDGMPIPDIVLTSFQGDRWVPPETVGLVVEVADSSFDRDLGRKAELYAAAAIPEYWVVDVSRDQVLVQWAPQDGTYGQRRQIAFGDRATSVAIHGLEVETVVLLG